MFNRHFPPFERPPRLFEKGDLKYVILDLLKEKPSHGYEIIRAMEESFHGFYTPSAGSVYPTLQMLDDMGYASSSEHDGKKVYTITDEGRKFLKEQQNIIKKIKGQMKEWRSPRNHDSFLETMHEIRNIGRIVGQNAHLLEPKQIDRIKKSILNTRNEIEEIIGKEGQT
jgi:DNA-binding PadR family transcriptional regulator